MRTGPILLIEDDEDDQLIFQQIVNDLHLPNKLLFFGNGPQLIDYLRAAKEPPFVILCDINMPLMNGLELRQRIEDEPKLHQQAIPFIFLTTDASPELIKKAYSLTIQGFFKKAAGYEAAKEQLRWIVGYWRHCLHPYNS